LYRYITAAEKATTAAIDAGVLIPPNDAIDAVGGCTS
jgi:hypothetical protein